MFLKHKTTGALVEVMDLPDVINPGSETIRARSLEGDIIQRPDDYLKTDLVFPSGEPLPRCWVDVHYYENQAA